MFEWTCSCGESFPRLLDRADHLVTCPAFAEKMRRPMPLVNDNSMPYPPDDWRYWLERGRREAEHERDANAQLAAALRGLVRAWRTREDMSVAWLNRATTEAEERAANRAYDAAWTVALELCPVDEEGGA